MPPHHKRTGPKANLLRYQTAPLRNTPDSLQLQQPEEYDSDDDPTREEWQTQQVGAQAGRVEGRERRETRGGVGCHGGWNAIARKLFE